MWRACRQMMMAAALGSVSLLPSAAQALTFQLVDYNGSVSGSAAAADFQMAADYWSSVITTNATVRINVEYNSLPTNVIGSTSSTRNSIATTAIYGALGAHESSSQGSLDAIAVANLRPLTAQGGTQMITNAGGTSGRIFDNDNSVNNLNMEATTANLKALGLPTVYGPLDLNADATIQFSNSFAFDFDASDGIDGGKRDFLAAAIHEIGHALGFVSGTDLYDTNSGSLNNSVYGAATPLDLFRYSNDPDGLAPGSGPWMDISTGGSPFFSIDGSTTFNGDAVFATGQNKGDGGQASHWKDQNLVGSCAVIGIMDPTLCGGQMGLVTDDDIAALDAIGWNTSVNALTDTGYHVTTQQIYSAFATQAANARFLSPTPEPASWALLLTGFGMTGAALRSARRRNGGLPA